MEKLGLNNSTRRPLSLARAAADSCSIFSPRPRIREGVGFKNSAQSEPSVAASADHCSVVSSPPEILSKARSAATALLLPPPKPAPSGIRFVSLKCTPPCQPVAAPKACAALKMRLDSSSGTAACAQLKVN